MANIKGNTFWLFSKFESAKPLFPVIAILIYIALIVLRIPSLFAEPRFWAEEGAIFFRDAYLTPDLSTLFRTPYGYYSILIRLVSYIAVHLPLKYAPFVYTYVGFLVQLLPAVLLSVSVPNSKSKGPLLFAAILCLILFVQPGHEIWLNTLSSKIYLSICGGICLISSPKGKFSSYFRLLVILIAGLNGLYSIFLLPCFFLKYALEKKFDALVEFLVLAGCALIQIGPVYTCITTGYRVLSTDYSILPVIFFSKLLMLPFLGPNITLDLLMALKNPEYWYKIFFLAITGGGYLLFLFIFIKNKCYPSLYLWVSGAMILMFSLLGSIGNANGVIAQYIAPMAGERYFFAPNVFFSLSVLLSIDYSNNNQRLYNLMLTIVVSWLIVLGGFEFTQSKKHVWAFSGPSWQVEVEQFHRKPNYEMKIWPTPWKMTLSKENK